MTGLGAGSNPAVLVTEVLGQVMEQPMAALLGLQHQGEGQIAAMPIFSSGSICTATVRLMRAAYSMRRGLSPVPDVRQVTRETARDDKQGVNPDVVAIAGKAGREPLGRHCDAAQPKFVERPIRGFLGCPLLDLDKRQHSAAPGHQVDLAARHTDALREDPPTPQAQPPGGYCLRLASAGFGLAAGSVACPWLRARA